MLTRWCILSFLLLSIIACNQTQSGDTAEQSPFVATGQEGNPHFDLPDIQENGELIVLTLYGPESYFEFRGEHFGVQFMIARQYAQSIGASVRVEVARNQRDLVSKLLNGEGDFIACQLPFCSSLEMES